MRVTIGNKKIGLSLVMLLGVAIVATAVANVVVWRGYFDGRAALSALVADTSEVKRKTLAAPGTPQDLEQRLAEARAALKQEQSALPSDINGNDVIGHLFKVARESNVDVIPVATKGWVTQSSGSHVRALRIEAAASGSLAQVMDYIRKLENGAYETLSIPDFSITYNSPPGVLESTYSTPVTARLNIIVYTGLMTEQGETDL